MSPFLQAVLSVTGRLFLSAIFVMSVVGNKIPNFEQVTGYMAANGVPAPNILLPGAIVFLLVGSASLILGYRARVGAVLLFVFLGLANYYFHDFWTLTDSQAVQMQTIQFLKNLSIMGGLLLVMANGVGPASLDCCGKRKPAA